jgi:hypothetical protein
MHLPGMHIKFLTALTAVAPVFGSPLTAPRDAASDAAAQLAAIAQLAYNTTLEDVESTSSKRSVGSCTLKNLRVRREWYV